MTPTWRYHTLPVVGDVDTSGTLRRGTGREPRGHGHVDERQHGGATSLVEGTRCEVQAHSCKHSVVYSTVSSLIFSMFTSPTQRFLDACLH